MQVSQSPLQQRAYAAQPRAPKGGAPLPPADLSDEEARGTGRTLQRFYGACAPPLHHRYKNVIYVPRRLCPTLPG